MCTKSLGQLFAEVEEKIEALEERVEQLEAEQRAPLPAPGEYDDLYYGYAYEEQA